MFVAALLALSLAASPPPAQDAGAAEGEGGFPPSVFPGSDAAPELTSEIDRALALRRESRHPEALAILEAVRRQALEKKHLAIATNALNRKGDLLHDLDRNPEAEQAYREAYEESVRRGDFWAMGRAAHDLALLSGVYSPDAKSLEWFKKALEARRRAQDWQGVRTTAHNLATAFREQGNLSAAEPYYEEALQAAEKIGDEYNHARMSLLYANLLLETGERRNDPALLAKGRTWLSKSIVGFDAAGEDTSALCSQLEADQRRRCEKHWPLDTPQARFARHRQESARVQLEMEQHPNGFPPTDLLLRGARAAVDAAKALRELGAEREERASELEREARGLLMEALANRDGSTSLGRLCAAKDVQELCELTGLKGAP